MGIRLSKREVEAIKSVTREVFGDGAVIYLFGSRVDPEKRGGDIDLFVELPENFPKEEIIDRKIKFLVRLKDQIGEQRIDLVVRRKGEEDFISKVAKEEGVRL